MSLENNRTYEAYSKKSLWSNSFARTLVTCFLCLIGIVILKFAPYADHSNKGTTIRGSVQENLDEKKVISNKENSSQQKGIDSLLEVEAKLENAEDEVEEAETQALENAEKNLKEVLSNVEVTLKKTLSQLLEKQNGYSTEEAKKVEEEVVERLEGDVIDRLEYEADSIKEDAMEDMETVFENDLSSNVDVERIESDVNVMRDYFVDGTKRNIERAGKSLESQIREITTEIEKEVISEKLGEEFTSNDLEESELKVKVTSAVDSINESERLELIKLQDDISGKTSEVRDKVKNVLRDFLQNEKGLGSDETASIEEEVFDRLEQEVYTNVKDKTEEIKQEVQESATVELDNLIDEDKFVLDRAKKLGFTTGSDSDVDLIEKDLKSVKKDFDGYVKDLTSFIEDEITTSMKDIVKNVEKDVLDKKGVIVTDAELDNLVARETNMLELKNDKSSGLKDSTEN